MKAKKLLIDLLDLDADTQSRVGLSKETIAEYVEAIKAGIALPPIDVFHDGSEYFIGDGWHRAYAWLEAGVANIPVTMHEGGIRDALLFAAGANQGHGLKRSNADKRRAVEILLRDETEWSEWSDRKIAEHCGVSNDFVSRLRGEVSFNDTSDEADEEDDAEESDDEPAPIEPPKPATRLGKDGKRYPVKEKPAPPKGPSIATLALPYQRATNDLLRISRDMKEIAETPAGAHLASKITRIVKSLEEAKQAIRQAEPSAVCGKCNGDGCQHCARTGFWTRMTVESKSK